VDLFFISQGSVVTHLRCGGKYDTSLIANLLLSPTVEEFLKSANISQSYELIASGTFFIAHGVVTKIYFAVTGVAGEASSKAKVSKAKAEKKSTKDDKPSEKAKPTKEVISRRRIELCV